jgi:pimeloyl-ACP methyl ester carboxylesterase
MIMIDQYMTSKANSTNVLLKMVGYGFWGLWLAAPTATSKLVLRLFFRTKSVQQKREQYVSWQSGTPFELKLHGRTLRGRYWGDGPGVLMVHGWNGHGSQFHRFITPVVERGYRAILIDGPAHGESDGSYTTYFEFTDMVRHLLRGEAGMRVEKVIAHSFGAGAVINALHKEQLSPGVALIAPAFTVEEYVQQSFQSAGFPFPLYRNLIGWLERQYGYNLGRDNPRQLLSKLSLAILLVHDRDDRVVPYDITEQFARDQSHLLLQSTEGYGHTRILQEQGAIDTVIVHLFGGEQRPVVFESMRQGLQ